MKTNILNRFEFSIDEISISKHVTLDQALEALKTTTIPKHSTGYVDSLDADGKTDTTIYTKENNCVKRVDE